jgi:hypothetical protein
MGMFMVRFIRCFLHALGSPLAQRKWGGDVAITSPFFCLADFLCCRLQPAGHLLLPCLTPHLDGEPEGPVHWFHQATWQPLHKVVADCRLEALRLHSDTLAFPFQ